MNMRFQPPIDGIVANVGNLFGLKGKGKESDETAIDVDEDGKTLFKEDVIQKVLEDLEKRKTGNIILCLYTLMVLMSFIIS